MVVSTELRPLRTAKAAIIRLTDYDQYTEFQKSDDISTFNSSVKNEPILTIFVTQNPGKKLESSKYNFVSHTCKCSH